MTAASTLTHDHLFFGDRHDANARATLWVVGLTAVMMVAEIIAGLVYGSMALLADGFHMASHAGALAIAAGAYAFARAHAHDRRFSFGTGKVGDLAGFASALVLALIALAIGAESVGRLFDPRPVAFAEATLVAIIGLIVNVASALLLAGGHHHHHGHDDHHHDHHDGGHHHDHGHHHHGDNNLRSAFVHVLADALTSVLAIVALIAGRLLGWVWLDPVMGIVGAIVIAVWAWNLLRDTAAVLLDTADAGLERAVRNRVEDGGTTITDLHIWRIGPGAHAAIVSVTGTDDAEAVRARLEPIPALAHLTVETR
ncbi:cation diffusion facilitator family transporter [Sphingomonas zeicaulis]|uniref:CDF family Co(II)/Ni(II) efflux transporter DmeF n=1 Tax=Sphingomonas zeicaulis TaxID=1632740 RepID=UPI003D2417B9